MCGVHPGDLTRWLLFPTLVTVGELVELAVLVVVQRVVVERSSLLFSKTEFLVFKVSFMPKLKRCASRDQSKIHDYN